MAILTVYQDNQWFPLKHVFCKEISVKEFTWGFSQTNVFKT